MSLDYTDGCVNFRDVGGYVNLILGEERLPEDHLYRGGSIDYVKEDSEIRFPKTIINLRNRPDYDGFDATYLHFPMDNKVEKYDTHLPEVRRWLNQILLELQNPDVRFPVLIHCLSGKDRTGIVVAAILMLLGIDENTIIEEYLLSEGEVDAEKISLSIDGMRDLKQYFNRIDLSRFREVVLGKK